MVPLIAIILVLVIIIIYFAYKWVATISTFLGGMWYADSEFCDKANISGMYLYIGSSESGKVRNGYIIIYDDDTMIANTKITIEFSISTVKINSEEKIEQLPSNMEYDLDIGNSILKLYSQNKEKLQACLIKDNEMTRFLAKDLSE
jgi:hypothetical protein